MWIFLIVVVLGIVLFNLGALSVLVSVLSVAFKAAIVVIAALGILMLYIQHGRK